MQRNTNKLTFVASLEGKVRVVMMIKEWYILALEIYHDAFRVDLPILLLRET